MDLNNLNQVTLIPNNPAVYPSYYPGAGVKAPTWNQFGLCVASQLGVTTLDTYAAPGVPVAANALGPSRAIAGNGIVVAGNAPYNGIYTGIQQE